MTTSKLFEKAQRLFVDGKLEESIQAFTQAMDAGEKSEIAYLSRGVAYLKNHETDRAISDFSKAVRKNDRNFRAHYYRGIAYLTKERYDNAIADFDKTIVLAPDNVAAYFARGTAYAHMGNEREATKNIKTAIMSSETNIMELSETIGLWRTQFDKTISLMTGKKKPLEMELTEDEVSTLMKWLHEGDKKATLH